MFVTIIVKFARSPTFAVEFSVVLTTVKLTCASTVMLVLFVEVLFVSVKLTTAMLVKVPLFITFTMTHTEVVFPLNNLSIVQVNLPFSGLTFSLALTNWKS